MLLFNKLIVLFKQKLYLLEIKILSIDIEGHNFYFFGFQKPIDHNLFENFTKQNIYKNSSKLFRYQRMPDLRMTHHVYIFF